MTKINKQTKKLQFIGFTERVKIDTTLEFAMLDKNGAMQRINSAIASKGVIAFNDIHGEVLVIDTSKVQVLSLKVIDIVDPT